jgi:diguanylate cyclase (GGDEF)-like protein
LWHGWFSAFDIFAFIDDPMDTLNSLKNKRILVVPFVVLTVALTTALGFSYLHFLKTAISRTEQSLTRLAHSGAKMVYLLGPNPGLQEFDSLADAFAGNGHFRVTIIEQDGRVLGDSRLSQEEVRRIENHADRPEVLMAKASGLGMARRFSDTLKVDLLYVAVPYGNRYSQGYFRVALPLTHLANEKIKQQLVLGAVWLGTLIMAAFLTWLASRHIVRLIHSGQRELERRVSERTREIETLQTLGTQLTVCKTREEALQVVKLVSSILLPGFPGSISLYRNSKNQLEQKISWNGDCGNEPVFGPDECWALRTGKLHVGNPLEGTMVCPHAGENRQRMICVPLVAQGVTHGVLHLILPAGVELTQEMCKLTNAVAEHTSLTLANLDLREDLRQQAIRDPLTGLYNRRYLMEVFDHELARAGRRQQQLGVLMIDVDHFKDFNDCHGHDAGDYVLSEIGLLIRKNIRCEDIACRYGGEEFALLLPETSREEALSVSGKLGDLVRNHNFFFKGLSLGPVTLSIGVASFPDTASTVEALLKCADKALYQAKNAGRDQALVWMEQA